MFESAEDRSLSIHEFREAPTVMSFQEGSEVVTELELHLGDLVAIADGSAYQGQRGTVVVLGDKEVVVELLTGERYTVGWWKDVQPVQSVPR